MQEFFQAPNLPGLPTSLAELLKLLNLEGQEHYANFARLGEVEVYLKLHTLKPSNRARQLFRGSGPWSTAPRVIEYQNLSALRAQGIGAVEPLVVAVERRAGLLHRELLATRKVPGTINMEVAARDPAQASRITPGLLARVGFEVGRMHAGGFRHRDLFLRNVLIDPQGNPLLIDCRKGSWGPRLNRDFSYDLACFEKWACALLSTEHRISFFAGYTCVRPISNLAEVLVEVEQQRLALVARYERKRGDHQRLKEPLGSGQALDLALVAQRRGELLARLQASLAQATI